MECNLCKENAKPLFKGSLGNYFRCSQCRAIFLSPEYFPPSKKEKERYETHNNDIENEGYRNFVSPIVNKVTAFCSPGEKGLDFGCGTGPVIYHMLKEKGYSVDLYDPFFENNKSALSRKYDFIICCEVIEHFHNPHKEFSTLYNLLNPGGKLYCMTNIFKDNIDFEKWYYKNDFTHVFFYHEDTFRFIQEYFNFKSFNVEENLIILEK